MESVEIAHFLEEYANLLEIGGCVRLYVPSRMLCGRGKDYQGSDYYLASNPPF